MATTQATVGVIKDASITAAKMAANSVDSDSYVNGSIDPDHLANDAVTLAKMAPAVDGSIISYDASQNPVLVAPGNDGQVLTSAGAGAQPAFEDAAGGGGTTFLDQAEASSSSTLAVSNMNGSNFSGYILTISDMVLSSTGSELKLRAVQSAGIFTGSKYNHNRSTINVGAASTGIFGGFGSANIGYLGLAEDINESFNASYLITTENAAPVWIQGSSVSRRTSNNTFTGGPFMGYIFDDLTLTGMILSLNTGNITKGTMTLTGIKNA